MIKKITALAADIDGTLVTKGEMIMPETKEAITRLHEQGVLFGLATGRAISESMFRRKDTWQLSFDFDFLIGINGGQVWDKDHEGIERYCLLDTETMREIVEMMAPLDLPACLYEGNAMVTTKIDGSVAESMRRNKIDMIDTHGDLSRIWKYPNNNIIFRFDPEKKAEVQAYIDAHPSPKYTAVHTSTGIVEFMDPALHKGVGLRKYAERNNIPLEEIIAFGDLDNDIELLMAAGWGVCLINGSDGAKAAADAITEYPCTEDGMGRYIKKHIFME